VSLLDRKLFRDINAMRGQIITIALLVAAGVAVFVASVSTYDTLEAARSRFYDEARFPDVFVTVKRAPLAIVPRLAEISGVASVELRIVRDVIVDWPSSPLPVSARMVSLSNGGNETLNRLHLRRGTGPPPGETRTALINEAFAEANGVKPGDDLRVVLNGRVETFHVSGIALSPEYVYAVKPGLLIPDDRYYAILWVDRAVAEAAFAMEGAFNDVVISLAPDANAQQVIEELDRLLEPYGAVGAIARRDQPSHRFLDDELNQQKVMSTTIPYIFFGVAAFLLNVALGRLVTAQREQIAALKALGFPTTPIVSHYLKLVAVIVLFGSLLGIAGGILFGHGMIVSYLGFFRFPDLTFEITPWSAVAGVGISFVAASLGVLTAVRNVVTLAPAVAMRPASPPRSRHALTESLLPRRYLTPQRMMILRNLAGRPFRALLTIVGIAFAVPMVVLGLFWRDAIGHMMEVQFNLVERGNTAVTFPHPLDADVLRSLAREPGVMMAEGQRYVPVRLRAWHRSYLTSVIGLSADAELRRPRDVALRPIEQSADGITLARPLAGRLGVAPGDVVTIEVMEGQRRKRDLLVVATVEEVLGMSAYMDIGALNRLTGEGNVISAAALFVEPALILALGKRFKDLPMIESVTMKANAIASFLDKIAGLVLVSAGILTGFAIIIAVGVVYNSARISLQERAWQLASLRVLGFTRSEVSGILFSEFLIEIAAGIPIGLALSQLVVNLIARFHSNETFQIPAVIGSRTFAAAAIVVIVAAAASAYVVRRRIDRLDLVAVLKTRD
jgi:putative ABC transport system permease protein